MSEYIVIGLGRFGRSLAVELQALGHEVLAVDADRQVVQEVSGSVRQAVEADATAEATLRELGVSDLDAAVVAIGNPEASIMVALLLKKLDVRYIIARATSELHDEILLRVGADRVVFPEKETALRLAHGISVPEIVDYLSLSTDMGISKLAVPGHLIGQSYSGTDLEGRYKVRIVAVIRRDRVLFGASVGEKFERNDTLIVSGRDSDLRALSQLAGKEA